MWHCHHAPERDAKSLSLQRCGHPNLPDLNPVDYSICVSFKRGSTVRRSMIWRSWKNVCWAGEGCWTTPSQQQQLRSGIVVWMHVFAWMVDILNINFEPLTFCCVMFLALIHVAGNSCKVVHEKLWKSVNICKSDGKKSVAPFFVDTV